MIRHFYLKIKYLHYYNNMLKTCSKLKNICCNLCDYKTDRNYNLARHIVIKHDKIENIEIAPKDTSNAPKDTPNAPKDTPNAPKNTPNAGKENPNDKKYLNKNQCEKCEKIFARHNYFIKHFLKCKGKKNNLECELCKEIFSCPPHKYRHQKLCKLKHAEINKQEQLTIIENQTNNNITNNINNGVINNNNNLTLIVYNHNDSNSFIKDHITTPELKNTLKIINKDPNDEKKVALIEEYVRQLLTNPDNRCIKKTNMRDIYSKIHIGNNNWITKTDLDIYPKLTCNIAEGLSELIISRRSDEQRMITEQKLKELSAFLDYMSENGYRNDDDSEINNQTRLLFNKLVKRIKGVVFDITKIKI